MASDGKTQLNDGAEANLNDSKPTRVPLPLRFRNPRGAGLSHQGEGTVPGDQEAVPEDHGDKTMPKFSYLNPAHIRDPRGVALSRPAVTENLDHAPENEMETTTPEVRFTHLPRLHNPRGVSAVKQIQKGMIKGSDSQAGEEGDKN